MHTILDNWVVFGCMQVFIGSWEGDNKEVSRDVAERITRFFTHLSTSWDDDMDQVH